MQSSAAIASRDRPCLGPWCSRPARRWLAATDLNSHAVFARFRPSFSRVPVPVPLSGRRDEPTDPNEHDGRRRERSENGAFRLRSHLFAAKNANRIVSRQITNDVRRFKRIKKKKKKQNARRQSVEIKRNV